MSKPKAVFIVITAIVLASAGIGLGISLRFHLEKETRFMMGTYVSISAVGPKKDSSKAINAALDRMQEIATKFNWFDPENTIYAFNHAGTPIFDPEILDLIRLALEVSRDSAGAFDITVEPLIELWGIYDKVDYLPSAGQIKDCLAKVGYRHLSFNNNSLVKDAPGVRISLGGIAKGYAVSEAVKVLRRMGVTSALVDAGGDIYALGKKGDKLWRVGIKNPRGEGILGYIEVEDSAVFGSGDYERFFVKDGKRYHHIFDPKTGYPTEGVASVTLIFPDPLIIQPWTKIPFVMGPKKGLQALEGIPGMEAIIVTSSQEVLYSSGLRHPLKSAKESH